MDGAGIAASLALGAAAAQLGTAFIACPESSADAGYRAALLDRIGLPYLARAPDIDESTLAGESPAETCVRLAEAKARAAASWR